MSVTLAKIDRAYDVVSALCEGKREWVMSIPARPDHDPDLIIGGALLAAKNEIALLARELEEARRERSAARAEALTAQASLRRVERELEEARNHARRVVVALRAICDEAAIGGPPLVRRREEWEAALSEADEVLGELEAMYDAR